MKSYAGAACLAISFASLVSGACYSSCPSKVDGSNCENEDYGCLCNSRTYVDNYNNCVFSSCPAQDNQQEAFAALIRLCNAEQVAITAAPEASLDPSPTNVINPPNSTTISAITDPLQGPPHHSTLSTIATAPGPACGTSGLFSTCTNPSTLTSALSTTFTNPISTISGNSSTQPGGPISSATSAAGTSTVLSTATASATGGSSGSSGSALGPSTNPGGPMSSALGGAPTGTAGAGSASTTPSTQSGDSGRANSLTWATSLMILVATLAVVCL